MRAVQQQRMSATRQPMKDLSRATPSYGQGSPNGSAFSPKLSPKSAADRYGGGNVSPKSSPKSTGWASATRINQSRCLTISMLFGWIGLFGYSMLLLTTAYTEYPDATISLWVGGGLLIFALSAPPDRWLGPMFTTTFRKGEPLPLNGAAWFLCTRICCWRRVCCICGPMASDQELYQYDRSRAALPIRQTTPRRSRESPRRGGSRSPPSQQQQQQQHEQYNTPQQQNVYIMGGDGGEEFASRAASIYAESSSHSASPSPKGRSSGPRVNMGADVTYDSGYREGFEAGYNAGFEAGSRPASPLNFISGPPPPVAVDDSFSVAPEPHRPKPKLAVDRVGARQGPSGGTSRRSAPSNRPASSHRTGGSPNPSSRTPPSASRNEPSRSWRSSPAAQVASWSPEGQDGGLPPPRAPPQPKLAHVGSNRYTAPDKFGESWRSTPDA